ncbi:MAG TPA: DUF4105 domain-containing protein [Kofleriaceae bacterium]|nr:DUF4105 domain-containing protein [Kofleriaceae bacterium]
MTCLAAAPARADVVPDPKQQVKDQAPGQTPSAETVPAVVPPSTPPDAAALAQQTPVIDLLTMGVGSLIWERHGHIALCVLYGDARDRCYNYGVGDFHHPIGMAWGFLRATGAFWVDKAPPEDMLWIYKHTDRTIWHQPLPLTPDEKKKVIAKLEHDVLPEYSHYAYDHFWDNCTTRVRDILDDATGGKLSAMKEPVGDQTFRDLARAGFFGVEMPLGSRLPLLVTDLAMGRATDRVPTYYERMFLPQYLREAATKLWGVQPQVLYERKGPPPASDGPDGRWMLVLAILVLTIPAWLTRLVGRFERTGLLLSILPYFVLGGVLTLLAIVSPLPYVRWNETCLVLFPLDIILPFLSAPRRRGYARARLIMIAVLFVLWLVHVIKAPMLAPMLWPAIPMAVAGLWPPRAARVGHAGKTRKA